MMRPMMVEALDRSANWVAEKDLLHKDMMKAAKAASTIPPHTLSMPMAVASSATLLPCRASAR